MNGLSHFKDHTGSMLISLMIFVVVSLTIVTAAVLLVVDNTITASNQQIGNTTLSIAESGVENALLRLLRNPSYTGEDLPVGTGIAAVTVTGTDPIIIRSTASNGSFERTIEVTVTRLNGVLTVNSWNEID